MPTATLVQQHQKKALTAKQEVCRMLGMNEQEYAEHQYAQGLSYLQWYLPNNRKGRSILERSKLYWNWYKVMWNAREEVYLMHIGDMHEMLLDKKKWLYRELHASYNVITDTKPPYHVTSVLFKKEKEVAYE